MECWMKELAKQHGIGRALFPGEKLMVVFDIDDTILDLRHMILHVLWAFDEHRHTRYFRNIALDDIGVGEFGVSRMMAELGIAEHVRSSALNWFGEHAWSGPVIRYGHRPFPGVMDVIGWLQAQARTFVGLNTGRPETMRKETLLCLNRIGTAHGVSFSDRLLFMNPHEQGVGIPESKVEGIGYFQDMGFRVVAFVDNEPENLEAVSAFDREGDILLLHADTVYSSDKDRVPKHAVSGKIYDPRSFAA
jgi:hypothetical protein